MAQLAPRMTASPVFDRSGYANAVAELLRQFSWNRWFLETYWPENEPRVRLMVRLVMEAHPSLTGPRLLDVGCGNGYMAYLFSVLGFEVVGTDACQDPHREQLFGKRGIDFRICNLNDVRPLGDFPGELFDVVLLGEVFEHVLNYPVELLRSLQRLLRPGGLLILTTPNPSTVANALRVLRDRLVLRGTKDFLRQPKINEERRIIDLGNIHYREYPARLVCELLREVGFAAQAPVYVRTGNAPSHPALKRLAKGIIRALGLSGTRLLAPGYVIVARKS